MQRSALAVMLGLAGAHVAAAETCKLPPLPTSSSGSATAGSGSGSGSTGDAHDPRAVAITVVDLTATIDFGNDRTRVVTAATCAELADAVALILAMADPPTTPPISATSATDATSETTAKSVPAWEWGESDDEEPGAPPKHRHSLTVREANALELRDAGESASDAHARDGFRAVVGASASHASHGWEQSVEIGGRWRRGATSIGGEVGVQLPDHVAIDTGGSGDVRVWGATATVTPCLHIDAIAACGVVQAGAVVGEGRGIMNARTATTPLLAIGGRLAWETEMSPGVGLRVHLDGLVRASTSRFDVDGMTVWSTDRIGAWGGFDVLVQIP
jgi:hypothetical protein